MKFIFLLAGKNSLANYVFAAPLIFLKCFLKKSFELVPRSQDFFKKLFKKMLRLAKTIFFYKYFSKISFARSSLQKFLKNIYKKKSFLTRFARSPIYFYKNKNLVASSSIFIFIKNKSPPAPRV